MRAYKHILLLCILVCLALPLLQTNFNFYTLKELSGDVTLAPDTSISTESWFNSTYQEVKEKYVNDNFGFRSFYVRLRNEVSYIFFNKVYAKDVIAGKSGFLYEIKYPQTYAGMDYVGDEQVDLFFDKLAFVQDTLQKKGITLALLFAPGKASYYPEYLPAPYTAAKITNYLRFSEEARKRRINHLDFNALFMKEKETTKYPLYPKTGTHWSVYGGYRAFDTLVGYMESKAGKKMPHFDYSDIELSDSLRSPDGDIAEGLNLLRELPHFTMAYPNIKWKDTAGTSRPRVLTVADSYWMGIYFTEPPQTVFSKHEFWYYNQKLYNYDPGGKTFDLFEYDFKTSVEKQEFIFIMATEASLRRMGWGFVDELYTLYKGGPEVYALAKKNRRKTAEINHFKHVMWGEEGWMKQLKKQAKDLGITLDSCMNMNAEFHYSEGHKNDPKVEESSEEKFNYRVLVFKIKMKANKEWYNYLVKKAAGMKISVDSCITLDAEWAVREEMFKERVAFYKDLIRAAPNWMKQIEAKSKDWRVSIDSAIVVDALYMAKEELKKK